MPDSIDKHLDTLSEIVGLDSIITETETLSAYSVDTVIPKGVVFPNDIEQVSEIVRLAGKENLSIIPWGGGSKMSMGNPPKRLDIIVNTSKLNRITDIDAANLTVTLQAGCRFKTPRFFCLLMRTDVICRSIHPVPNLPISYAPIVKIWVAFSPLTRHIWTVQP